MISPFTALGIKGAKGNLSESLASPCASWLRGGAGRAGQTEQSVVFSPRQLISMSSADAKISKFTTNNANLAGDDGGMTFNASPNGLVPIHRDSGLSVMVTTKLVLEKRGHLPRTHQPESQDQGTDR